MLQIISNYHLRKQIDPKLRWCPSKLAISRSLGPGCRSLSGHSNTNSNTNVVPKHFSPITSGQIKLQMSGVKGFFTPNGDVQSPEQNIAHEVTMPSA